MFPPPRGNDRRRDMRGKPKKPPRQKDLTSDYLSGSIDEDRVDSQQRFSDRSKHHQQNKILRTAEMRRTALEESGDLRQLPTGQVVQVHSLYCDVRRRDDDGATVMCVVRKTLVKVQGEVVVGDRVHFRPESSPEPGAPQGVVELILPRATVLTRADSFKARVSHPIVANAEQVLIVVSLVHPRPKWGLIDRMVAAARAGGLLPVICLNKTDLAAAEDADGAFARSALEHYRATFGLPTIEASAEHGSGIPEVRDVLRGRETVLAGHSGVGKSSLIRAVQPTLDLRVGEVSSITQKGRHTTTSARRYPLEVGGAVIDTPGVKLFGLWNVTRENLIDHFPDVASDLAPAWRSESYERILSSLP